MTPLVDIIMPTYNHERFVGQAIESVLAQKTDFEYRLMIGDDCSSDGTPAIIREYAQKHPDRVKPFLFPEHVGAQHRERVGVRVLRQCTARYVCLIEGDDYWTDPYKLQKQVDFLERHPECSACYHDALMFFDDGSQAPRRVYPPGQKEISTLEDMLTTGVFLMPCTMLFRNVLGELPDCYYGIRNADWMLSILIAERGQLGYIDEVMAAYRVHGGGIWSRLKPRQRVREQTKSFKTIDAYLNFKYHDLLAARIAAVRKSIPRQHGWLCLAQYHSLVKKGEVREGLRSLWEAARYAPSEVFSPRGLAAVLKNGFFGLFAKGGAQK